MLYRGQFQSPTVLLPPALATGNLTIRTDAMVYEVSTNAEVTPMAWLH